MRQMYNGLEIEENEDDTAVDAAGYTGNFRRVNQKSLQAITQAEFMQNFRDEHKLAELMRVIGEIDKDRNGYVTNAELDDILKMLFPSTLANKNLRPVLVPY